MVLSQDAELDLHGRHQELSEKLRLDSKAVEEAWESFQAVNKNFTLEGEPLQWSGCAIYVTAWKYYNQGNGINLTLLLRYCCLSLAQFFTKIRQWCDMTKPPENFIRKIDNLEKAVTVLCNVFNDYQTLFVKIFKTPDPSETDQTKHQKNRKQKPVPCTPLKLFEFCWTLFITIKDDTNYTKDLVTLCRLIRAVCDWAFKEAFLNDRKDLLNPSFEGLPPNWSSNSYITPKEAPCIIDTLSSSPENIFVKYMKEYEFKNSIEKFFKHDKRYGKDDLFDVTVFDQNFKTVTNAYDAIFLSKGDLDERIFLAEYRRTLLEKDQKQVTMGEPLQCEDTDENPTPEAPQEGYECLTPLTGRKYLGPRDLNNLSSDTITRLTSIVAGRRPFPGEVLNQLLQSCARNPLEKINEILVKLGNRFLLAYGSNEPKESEKRLQLATTLFYKYIENILQNESLIQSDISAIVEKEVFYESMFACCLEIVIYAYNSRRRFPWVLDALQISAYNFIKVIELIIRSKDKLSRDTIKHLNMIEETILSSIVWRSDSLIWDAIATTGRDIPKFEETALPGHLQTEPSLDCITLRSILTTDSRQVQSPGPSATDRFQSPVTHNSAINRELFSQTNQSILLLKDSSGATRVIPVVNEPARAPTPSSTPRRTDSRPRRTGGLSILFRKFYNLSGERMEHLCTHLKITNIDTKRKIWTVFEELVRKNHCELMKDRDLDQLLMCAVYMISKITQLNLSFAEIIKSYRSQPQATSDIYRQVLVKSSINEEGANNVVNEVRGDLILFYNTVIIQTMKRFVQKFVDKVDENNGDVLLSPLPASRHVVHQVYDNIFVKPLESPTTVGFSTGRVYNYYFSRSPSKDLKDINKAIKGNGVQGKRLLVEEESELPNTKRFNTKKLQTMIEDRRSQNTE